MPTLINAVSAVGAFTAQWTLGAGADKVVAVQTIDDDTSYITAFTAGDYQSYVFDNAPSTPGLLILAARVKMRCSAPGVTSGTLSGGYNQAGGVPLFKGTFTITSGAYTDYVSPNIGNPYNSGGAWTVTDYNNSNVGVEITTIAGGGTIRCTYLVSEMDYDFAGGFTSLVFGLLGPLVAVGLHEIPHLAKEISFRTRGRLRIRADEYITLYRELRENKNAKYFLLGTI